MKSGQRSPAESFSRQVRNLTEEATPLSFFFSAVCFYYESDKFAFSSYCLSGQCVFGTSCRFSHMSERHMKMLEEKIDGEVLQQ